MLLSACEKVLLHNNLALLYNNWEEIRYDVCCCRIQMQEVHMQQEHPCFNTNKKQSSATLKLLTWKVKFHAAKKKKRKDISDHFCEHSYKKIKTENKTRWWVTKKRLGQQGLEYLLHQWHGIDVEPLPLSVHCTLLALTLRLYKDYNIFI